MLLILLAAALLRLYDLAAVPPGLTHDEADHGLTAWNIVNGQHAIYFTIGYGREPLYDYVTAALMSFTGPTYLANRLVAVYFSLLLVAGMYAWVRRGFDRPTALLTAAGLAVSFWPLMTGRQALRSTLLPALFVLAVLFFWNGLERGRRRRGAGEQRRGGDKVTRWQGENEHLVTLSPCHLCHALAGLFLGLTFYTYIPARVLWLVLPLVVLYRMVVERRLLKGEWIGLGVTLLTAALIAAPLFFYLNSQPDIEVRLEELSAPLTAAANGDWSLLLSNAAASLRLFTIEGDMAWRYNIAGRPFLPLITGLLFYLGVVIAIAVVFLNAEAQRGRGAEEQGSRGAEGQASVSQSPSLSLSPLLATRHSPLAVYPRPARSAAFLALGWLVAGLSPVLVTGPELATTQAIGMQPVVYLFPAIALVTAYRTVARMWRPRWLLQIATIAVSGFFMLTMLGTIRDYFGRWANAPEVRVQYETTLVTTLRYLEAMGVTEAAVSTITPAPFHSPAVALLVADQQLNAGLRWFDGRSSLIFPGSKPVILTVPGFAPVAPELSSYLAELEPVETLPMRPTDEDRPVRIYRLDNHNDLLSLRNRLQMPNNTLVTFGESLALLGYEVQTPDASPGEVVTLVTLWRSLQPLPQAMLFTHLLAADGSIVVQADALGAPGEFWHFGDQLLQLHQLTIPAETPEGEYQLVTGVYTLDNKQRLPVDGRASGETSVNLTTVTITR